MPIEDNLPWQKRCERARRILAEGLLRSNRPGQTQRIVGNLFRNASATRDFVAQVMRSISEYLLNALSKAKRNFQAGECRDAGSGELRRSPLLNFMP
jgi:hypothetical protein